MKMKALVLPPTSRLDEVCSAECRRLLNQFFDPVWNDTGRDYTEQELAVMIREAGAVLTSWGSPPLSEETLRQAERLRYIGHAAGTVKGRVPREAFVRNIRVFSAAPRIAQSVGEYCLGGLLAALRNLPRFNQTARQGIWKVPELKGHELAGQTVGLISASSTARAFIRLLSPFHVQIKVCDPYLKEEAASDLGVRLAPLAEVMQCPIISVHAPKLPETEKMITRELIALIPDGAIFINSSRASVVDEEALLEQLQSGRFQAALDVFSKEPLPDAHPFTRLDNVLLTPHVAGASVEGHYALMEEVVRDILRAENGEATRFEVSEQLWDRMA